MDGKTGLLNAAAWHDKAERALRRAQRQGAVAGVDLLPGRLQVRRNHLRAPRADAVLAAVAAHLRAEAREGDVVGLVAAREFVVSLRDLYLTSACCRQMATIAERIRCVAEPAVAVDTRTGLSTIDGVSTSVGAVFDLGRTCTLQQVLGAADAALYSAKVTGGTLAPVRPARGFCTCSSRLFAARSIERAVLAGAGALLGAPSRCRRPAS